MCFSSFLASAVGNFCCDCYKCYGELDNMVEFNDEEDPYTVCAYLDCITDGGCLTKGVGSCYCYETSTSGWDGAIA
jgi:hypothetical protein